VGRLERTRVELSSRPVTNPPTTVMAYQVAPGFSTSGRCFFLSLSGSLSQWCSPSF